MASRRLAVAVLGLTLIAAKARGQQPLPRANETIQVTATKIAEDVSVVPMSMTVVDGDELRARGAQDLGSALAFVAGVSLFPGGDAGPAAGVPGMWGVREADAFLLVVDGVPWGGAFNPDLPSISLADVDRIEVLRGAAPVMYGATSFTGVIHVIHREAGAPGHARAAIASHSSSAVAATVPLSASTAMRSSITADYERRGLADERSGFDRMHALFRGARDLGGGTLRFDVDAARLLQSPASPHPRKGGGISPLVPLDANHNPAGAKLDQDSVRFTAGFDRKLGVPWTTTLSLAKTRNDILRGFLGEEPDGEFNAEGYRQDRDVTDVWFDSHLVFTPSAAARIIAGVDHLHGEAGADSALFEYAVPLAGGAPSELAWGEETRIEDRRDFTGVYVQSEWTPLARLRVDAGARWNRVRERRTAEDGSERMTASRGSGGIGAIWRLTDEGAAPWSLFANWRSTFKPAAFDFSPHGEEEILRPETATSWQAGVRGRAGVAELELSAFRNDLENLLVSTVENGLPALENAGAIRVDGVELELRGDVTPALHGDLAWAYHDARFRDYEQAFDGVPTQLAGHRFEMSPLHIVSAGLRWDAGHGPTAHAELQYNGARYLNKRNTAQADPFTVWSAGLGLHLGQGELRLDGRNLTDERPPIAESELGDAQYYRMPGRDVELSYVMTF